MEKYLEKLIGNEYIGLKNIAIDEKYRIMIPKEIRIIKSNRDQILKKEIPIYQEKTFYISLKEYNKNKYIVLTDLFPEDNSLVVKKDIMDKANRISLGTALKEFKQPDKEYYIYGNKNSLEISDLETILSLRK